MLCQCFSCIRKDKPMALHCEICQCEECSQLVKLYEDRIRLNLKLGVKNPLQLSLFDDLPVF